MNPLSKNTWLSFLQIKQYEFRFLATVGIVKSIAPVLLLRATALADTFNKTQKDEGSGKGADHGSGGVGRVEESDPRADVVPPANDVPREQGQGGTHAGRGHQHDEEGR